MSKVNIIDAVEITARPEPVMPGACQSGGCGGPAPDSRVQAFPSSFGVVKANGVEIKPDAIAREIQHHPAADGETAWREAARALVIRELLLQEARHLKIEFEYEQDELGRRETDEEAMVRALLEQQINPATAGDVECRRYYEGHTERFRTPDLFEPSHILLEPKGDTEREWIAAEDEARVIAAEVGNDPRLFAAAAREFSKCPTAHQDGSLGQVRRGELVEPIQTMLESLDEGTTGRTPVRSRFGVHLLHLHRRIDGNTLPYEVVKDKIADMLEARSWAVAAATYAAELARDAEIEGVLVEPENSG